MLAARIISIILVDYYSPCWKWKRCWLRSAKTTSALTPFIGSSECWSGEEPAALVLPSSSRQLMALPFTKFI